MASTSVTESTALFSRKQLQGESSGQAEVWSQTLTLLGKSRPGIAPGPFYFGFKPSRTVPACPPLACKALFLILNHHVPPHPACFRSLDKYQSIGPQRFLQLPLLLT